MTKILKLTYNGQTVKTKIKHDECGDLMMHEARNVLIKRLLGSNYSVHYNHGLDMYDIGYPCGDMYCTTGKYIHPQDFEIVEPVKKIRVGVHDNSSDWGIIGEARTERGALRIGRQWARGHSSQTGYAGYGPTITLHYPDGSRDQKMAW